ncbi:uncharacterized protein LOC116116807 [Pistacia vera]|uniref:uncharacterized protein LOC116116780 n=1 Tax=Pistacia vera TaxID=55513 RepID=UPI0012632F28|nr:uncharacterized protein LOC116116780 [Pistacia vera]XP_031258692.1 uncharacterized protein LOC116116780 [Pistacia vera]XP_031258720.1 uncharacterized protein LOC116116807 [Pistacia vera]XP_031258721.1 uncharacterized protein LOC116116807 [Pistacia vera]
MASSKVVSRLCSRLQSHALKLNKTPLSTLNSPFPASTRPISRISRLPVELSSLDSMLPLHSATASARLRSSLSLESHCWGLVPQGISMPL